MSTNFLILINKFILSISSYLMQCDRNWHLRGRMSFWARLLLGSVLKHYRNISENFYAILNDVGVEIEDALLMCARKMLFFRKQQQEYKQSTFK